MGDEDSCHGPFNGQTQSDQALRRTEKEWYKHASDLTLGVRNGGSDVYYVRNPSSKLIRPYYPTTRNTQSLHAGNTQHQ